MAGIPLKPPGQRRLGAWLLGGGIALALRSWGLPLPLWPCPVRELTGIPCPTCYLTRSWMAAWRGDLAASLHWHPLGLPLLLAAAGLTLALLLGRLPRPRRLIPLAGVASGTAAVVWLIRLWRWGHGEPLPG